MVTKVQFCIAFMFQHYFRLVYIVLPVHEMASAVVDVGLRNPQLKDDVRGKMGVSCPSGRVNFGRVQCRSETNFKTRKPCCCRKETALFFFGLKFA